MLEDIRAGKPIPKTKTDPKSCILSIDDPTLKYASPIYGSWEIPITEVVAFGEYTTDNGPYIDDWFMVFVTRDFGWVEASNYCEDRDEVRTKLAKHWSLESLSGKLWGSTTFNNRVIWPLDLAELPLFEFKERPQSAWENVKSFGMGLIDKNLTQEVRNHLQIAQQV